MTSIGLNEDLNIDLINNLICLLYLFTETSHSVEMLIIQLSYPILWKKNNILFTRLIIVYAIHALCLQKTHQRWTKNEKVKMQNWRGFRNQNFETFKTLLVMIGRPFNSVIFWMDCLSSYSLIKNAYWLKCLDLQSILFFRWLSQKINVHLIVVWSYFNQ